MKLPLAGLLVLAASLVGASPLAQSDLLYAADFEADDGGLAATGDWEHGAPTSGPGSAVSGIHCWGTNLDGAASDSTTSFLTTPPIDASVAATADGVLVSWWQYIDDFASFDAFVVAYAGGSVWQHVFGLRRFSGSTSLPHVGWKRFDVLLGPEFATDALTLEFRFDGGSQADGMYVDDLSVSVLRATTITLEDFEASDGAFDGDGLGWKHGMITSCPAPVSAASGLLFWANSLSCNYGALVDQALVSRDVDLTPYVNRDAVYLRWQRYLSLEFGSDGVHHEVSYDGGSTWEYGAGFHGIAQSSSGFGWTAFGLGVDPGVHSQVRLRLRLTSDSIESGIGAWFDDFELAVPEVVPGGGANPPGSLRVSTGSFGLGSTVTLDLDDPSGDFAAAGVGAFLFALGPDANLPAGTAVPGWGMSGPGDAGDLLVDLTSVVEVLAGTPWAPGQPSQLTVPLPSNPAFVGIEVWLQGALVGVSGGSPSVGLTNGLYERL